MITFAINSGLRQTELLSLQWSRVDLLRQVIIIQQTKNSKPKTLPLNSIALNILMERSQVRSIKNDLVFFSNNGTRILARNLIRAFGNAVNRAGIINFWWHDLRHTFATRLAQNGVDLYKISKLLGHHDIHTTQRYAHHCPESLRDGVKVLEVNG